MLLRPLEENTAVAVADQLLDIFCMFGAPVVLESDNGREFSFSVISYLQAGLYKVHHTFIFFSIPSLILFPKFQGIHLFLTYYTFNISYIKGKSYSLHYAILFSRYILPLIPNFLFLSSILNILSQHS